MIIGQLTPCSSSICLYGFMYIFLLNILNCFCLFFLNAFLYLVQINQMEWSGNHLYYALNCCVLTKALYIMFQSAPNQV